MKIVFPLLLLLTVLSAKAQQVSPKWIVLEKSNSVGIIKPGINDLMMYIGATMKSLDKEAFEEIARRINFGAGDVVLVTGGAGADYMATDIEGRTLVIKGKITVAEQKAGSGVGYIKEDMTIDGVLLRKGRYVWIKGRDAKNMTIQFAGNKFVKVPVEKVYDIDATSAEMASTIEFKAVE